MANNELVHLSRRERQIMDIVYQAGQATAGEIQERLPQAPSYSATRALLRVLEQKRHLRHLAEGTRYVYLPTLPKGRAQKSALENLLQTFFEGSTEKAVAALLDLGREELSAEELARISRMIREAREEGR